MAKKIIYIISLLMFLSLTEGWLMVEKVNGSYEVPNYTDVYIGPNAIAMPVGNILLVRKDGDYCAIRFTEFNIVRSHDEDRLAKYESHFQGDKTGDFLNQNVEFRKEKLYNPKATWSFLGHPVATGAQKEIKCGNIRLWWTGAGFVYFFKRYQKEGDYGIELAPTKWTDIKEVNVFDPRVKWYRYDEKRKRVNTPIDQLWQDTEEEKQARERKGDNSSK